MRAARRLTSAGILLAVLAALAPGAAGVDARTAQKIDEGSTGQAEIIKIGASSI
jgi:hypothetical protein